MKALIEKDDLVILGNRGRTGAVRDRSECELYGDLPGSEVPEKEILRKAEEKADRCDRRHHTICFTVARLINQSIPVKYFMTKENLVTFHMDDYVDDVQGNYDKEKIP